MRMKYPDLPRDAQLFTYVQPPDKGEGRDRVAVFAVKSPDPKGRPVEVLTPGSMWYSDWTKATWAHERLVGIPDPAIEKFEQVVRAHIRTVKKIAVSN